MSIVGISCRFPGGANSKDSFWDMLLEGRCSIGSYPTNRPDAREFTDTYNSGKNTPGKHYVLTGSFLENITGFDAQFFGISPSECRSMDPQQRILLQVVFEAIEDAGIRLEELQQCRTGVYVGSMNTEYGALVMDPSNIRKIDHFSSTGSALSVIANRISFSLNLTGPSLAMDTACSSSLVALDIAFLHLQNDECDAAIVCAPNILLVGNKFHTACCRTGLLAEDGRCKSFDIKGDGYGRGEGVAAIIIKPTQTALDDRDNIYAEVVACGTNNDGQTAIPMTAPSEVTQAALFERVLRESGLSKDDISYVEAHGTGTAVGDVVEMGSLADVYGNSSLRVLRVGSVKSNINHTESTAGLAGLIKVCLMIKHAQYVPTVNVHQVKPQLKMSERKMVVQVRNEPWETEDNKPRTAAVSSYGFGGANAHAIVREVTQKPATIVPMKTSCNRVLTLSAASKDALRVMAKKVSQILEKEFDDVELLKDDLCYSLNERYTMQSHRLAISFYSLKDAARGLDMFASQTNGWEELVATGDVVKPRNKVVFLYGGQGTQWYGMAKEMLVHEPNFKESIAKIDALLKKYNAPWSLTTELNKPEEASRLDENPIGQTALFALHFALTELLNSWGIRPSAVVGHSLGEISAAWASGALPLNKALQLVLFRSQLHEKCSPTGCMVAIGMSEEDVRRMLQDLQLEDEVDVAVVNSPGNVVLSGNKRSLDIVENHVSSQKGDIFLRKLTTTRAYHSREMDEIKQAYFKLTSKFNVRQTQSDIPFYSTVTGSQLSGHLLSLEHWWCNIRQTVQMESALKNMFSDDHNFFIEINAAPQLSHHVRRTWSDSHQSGSLKSNDIVVVQTLSKRSVVGQHLSFLQNCVARLFVNGVSLSWNKIQGSGSKSFCPRPTYPWQEKEFWYRDAYPPEFVTFLVEQNTDKGSKTSATFHPLLGKTVPTERFTGLHAWESEINLHNVSFIEDHKFSQSPNPVIPSTVYIEMIAAMSLHLSPRSLPDIRNISFDHLLTISNNDSYRIRTRLLPGKSPGEDKPFQITLVESNEEEIVISQGSIQLGIDDEHSSKEASPEENLYAIEVLKSAMEEWSKADVQKVREDVGFAFGPRFDLISQGWSNGSEALSLIIPTEEIINSSAYVMHPCVIDACLQTTLLLKSIAGKYVPKEITNITILRNSRCTQQFYAQAKIVSSGKTPTYNITLMDQYGQAVMIIEKFITVEILLDKEEVTFDNATFTFGWQQMATGSLRGGQDYIWLILRDQSEFAERFTQHIPQCDSVHFFDAHDTSDKCRDAFSHALDELLGKIKGNEKWRVINFWPVDASKFDADANNFGIVHSLAFESCLSISQEILKREALLENIHLTFVTSGVVSIPDYHQTPTSTFPWSASVLGFRRTFSQEIAVPAASVIDLPAKPTDEDFHAMLQEFENTVLEEEIAFRNGVRYVNRIKTFDPGETKITKRESPFYKDGTRKQVTMANISGQLFLQKGAEWVTEKMQIEIHSVCPILHERWENLRMNDRVSISGKVCNGHKENHGSFVVGVCKVSDLGSFVAAEKCSFTEMNVDFTAQQAASIGFPMAMSYHIIANILRDLEGEINVLFYHQNEVVCFIFACVAASMDKKVVCLVENKSSKNRIKQFGKLLVITKEEITRSVQMDVCLGELDAVCLLSRIGTYVTRQIVKHLKPKGTVISSTLNGVKTVTLNPWIHMNDVRFILTSLQNITENSGNFSELLHSCCSVLKSKGLWKNLLSIPQEASSIYEVTVFRDESNKQCIEKASDVESKKEFGLKTVSLKPTTIPDQVDFYSLPLDDNGLKKDRTYLVIGGVRGFGFEVARWMVENGAKTVVCTARSAPSEEKIAEVQRLEKKTASRIILRQADVTSWKEMDVIKSELERLPSVAGIVFTAMVLVDQLLIKADLKTCRKVVGTKIQGSVILHQLSLSMDLDFFIMFSSISGVLGNAGQVSYAAANSFLDQLCEYRRNTLGLPALSINWGPISGVGVLERKNNITSILETYGLTPLRYSKAIEFMQAIILQNFNEAQVCVCPVNWQVYLKKNTSPRLQQKRDETMVVADDVMKLEDLALQPLEFRVNYVQDFVKRLLSSWSGSEISELDLNMALHKYGIDSIAATNMKLRIKSSIGANFETFYFVQPKVNGLTIVNDILEQIDNINTKSLKNGSEGKVNQRKNSLPDNKGKDFSSYAGENILSPEFTSVSDVNNENELELISVEKPSNPEKVIPLYTPENAFVKVFMVHASQKTALALASFAQGFQKQVHIALYGIGVDDTSFQKSDYGTVLTLAQRYVDLIKKIQPSGPFYLAGYSFGGLLAYEMASELKRSNETAAIVFMVDTFSWHPKALTNCNEFMRKSTEYNLKITEKIVTRQLIEKMAFVELGINKHELDNFYEELKDEDEVVSALEDQAAVKNLVFPLKEKVDTVQYELRSAATAYLDWQPSKRCYEGALIYVCSDETKTFSLSTPAVWKTLVERMDLLYVPGSHLELRDETRGEICGSMLMTAAAMAYLSKFPYHNFQAVRSRRQERLVESLKRGIEISMLSNPSSSKWIKGTLFLDLQETVYSFRHQSFGFAQTHNMSIKDLTNIVPGRHVDIIQKYHGNKSYVDLLTCMLTKKSGVQTFRSMDWQRLKLLMDGFEAHFGIPFMQ
ncbi:uncharacterized protein LOC114538524 [Dendronephthya gigantea]|uniref:uncharacterized protein LOC114538524 n=1 Tax=Dendronephthya gigantea TaxID=151771 RepID=UPI00106B5047|nr:uncharacterized protein LOC114538524 [Dendronephthya gigantea]